MVGQQAGEQPEALPLQYLVDWLSGCWMERIWTEAEAIFLVPRIDMACISGGLRHKMHEYRDSCSGSRSTFFDKN